MLSKLHNSGGWTGVHDALRYSLNSMINIHLNLLPANSPGRQALESELQLVENTHAEVKRRSSHQMDFIGQEQEIAFTQSLERLTMITMLFAPFSTIAQIFSIQDTYRFSYFAAMVIPIVGFCILFGIRGLSRRDARGLLEWCMSVWTAIAGFGRFRRRLGKERDDRSSGSDVEDSSGKAEGVSHCLLTFVMLMVLVTDPRRNLYKEITARKASLANRTLKSFIKGGERTKNQLSEFQFGGESDI